MAAADPATGRAVRAFMQRLEGRYAVRDSFLYGSRVRGTHTAESDADVAVILRGDRGDRYAAVIEMAGIAVEVFEETGILVQALPIWEGEFDRPELFSNPTLVRAIRREGLRF